MISPPANKQCFAKHRVTPFDPIFELHIARKTGSALSFVLFDNLNKTGWSIYLFIAFGTSISIWHDLAPPPPLPSPPPSSNHDTEYMYV